MVNTQGMNKSVILLQNEKVYDDTMTLNGKSLMTTEFIISVYDSIVPQDILEKRIGVALSNRGRTLYYVNWQQGTVVYREAIQS